MNQIVLDSVSKAYCRDQAAPRTILQDVSVCFPSDSITSVIGPNGCGKTTLVNLAAGLIPPDTGSVTFEVDGIPKTPRVGYVWQDYRATLLPWLNVQENIAFPLRFLGFEAPERGRRVREFIAELDTELDPTQNIYELSGGKQQLVCLLRSLISRPDCLFFDEPLTALDQPTRWSMAFRIERVWLENPVPAILVSHDIDEAIMLSDRVLLLNNRGGDIDKVLANPLPRPRNARMLTAQEHVSCREAVIEFLFEEGAIRDISSAPASTPARVIEHSRVKS